MRMIDADKLIKWIEYWDKNLTKDINAPDVGAAYKIIEDVLQTVVDYVTDADALEWIPISEGMPEDGENVLVTERYTALGRENVEITSAMHYVFAKGSEFLDERGEDITHVVKAWMPLPKPWEDEK